jgi:hypothetical protein
MCSLPQRPKRRHSETRSQPTVVFNRFATVYCDPKRRRQSADPHHIPTNLERQAQLLPLQFAESYDDRKAGVAQHTFYHSVKRHSIFEGEGHQINPCCAQKGKFPEKYLTPRKSLQSHVLWNIVSGRREACGGQFVNL